MIWKAVPSHHRVNAHLPGQETVLLFLDPLSAGREWDELVKTHAGATFFHSAAWARVLVGSYPHRPFYLVLKKGGALKALVPVMEVLSPITGARGISLPFSDLCPPLLFGEENFESVGTAFWDLGKARQWKYLELRGLKNDSEIDRPSFYTHSLSLDESEETLFQRCAPSVRRAIRKTEKAGLTSEVTSDHGALEEFYTLHCQTRRRHGLPPQPWKFFEQIFVQIIVPHSGFIVVVRKADQPIAAAVFFQWDRKVIYKFGAAAAAFQDLRPSNLLIWEAIRSCRERGMIDLHFGRTDASAAGLRRFKLGWGTTEEPLFYQRFDFRRHTWEPVAPTSPSGLHHHFFRRAPLSINRIAGRILYPYLD